MWLDPIETAILCKTILLINIRAPYSYNFLLKLNWELTHLIQNNLSNWGILNLNRVIISRFLRILASQNRFNHYYMMKYEISIDS